MENINPTSPTKVVYIDSVTRIKVSEACKFSTSFPSELKLPIPVPTKFVKIITIPAIMALILEVLDALLSEKSIEDMSLSKNITAYSQAYTNKKNAVNTPILNIFLFVDFGDRINNNNKIKDPATIDLLERVLPINKNERSNVKIYLFLPKATRIAELLI